MEVERVDGGAVTTAPPPEWVNRMSRAVGNDGRVEFQHLRPAREYRLAIVRSGERFESPTHLVLQTDELVTVSTAVPAATLPGDDPITMPLAIDVTHARAAQRPVGVHWKE